MNGRWVGDVWLMSYRFLHSDLLDQRERLGNTNKDLRRDSYSLRAKERQGGNRFYPRFHATTHWHRFIHDMIVTR